MQIDQFQPSGASSPQVVWFAGTSHVSIRGLRGIVDVSFALGLVYVGTMRGTCVFCWILDDGGEKVSWSWWWKEIQVVFFKIRQTWKFKGPFFIVFCGDYFFGACNKNWLPLMWGQYFRSQYCKDPKIKESGVFKRLPVFPPFVGGKIMISVVFNACFSPISSRPRPPLKDRGKMVVV